MTATIKATKQAKTTTTRKATKRRATSIHATREAWMTAAIELFRPAFAQAGRELRSQHPQHSSIKVSIPRKVRASCSWPSHRGTSARARVIGQCWSPKVSGDKATEIFVTPVLDSAIRILDVLCHELIHAALGNDVGHGPLFARVATILGLEGKPTATVAGEEFIAYAQNVMLPALGRYPHKKMNVTDFEIADGPKKQGTRMIKCECGECGYIVRTTQKWVDVAIPQCPDQDCENYQVDMEVDPPKAKGKGRPKA